MLIDHVHTRKPDEYDHGTDEHEATTDREYDHALKSECRYIPYERRKAAVRLRSNMRYDPNPYDHNNNNKRTNNDIVFSSCLER